MKYTTRNNMCTCVAGVVRVYTLTNYNTRFASVFVCVSECVKNDKRVCFDVLRVGIVNVQYYK